MRPLTLDIQSNDFCCSYLDYYLMNSLDGEKIQLATDQYTMEKPSVRGINCNVYIHQNDIDGETEFASEDSNDSNVNENKREEEKDNSLLGILSGLSFALVILLWAALSTKTETEKIEKKFIKPAGNHKTTKPIEIV